MIEIFDYSEKKISSLQIKELFESAFKASFNEKDWDWRFLKNPNSSKVFISYAEDNGKIVAYYAVSPMKLNLGNNKFADIALSNMTMTHPGYQGQGLFTKLAVKLFENLKAENFIGVYGFANSNSHYGFRKNLGWNDISILNIFKVKKEGFRDFLIKENNISEINEGRVNDLNLDYLENYFNSENRIKTHYDKANFKWRYIDNPDQEYQFLEINSDSEIKGKLIFKQFGNEIDLMEFWCNTIDSVKKNSSLVLGINYLIKKYSCDINLWSNLHSEEHIFLEKYGFKEDMFNTYFGIIPLQDDDSILNIKNWHFRFSDSDIF
jgi:hypothetical protein